MIRQLALVTAMVLSLDAFATYTPLNIKGQSQLTKAQASNLEVPNSLFTQTANGTYLNETGNTNLLVNPSFEHSTFNTGWTCTGVTPIAETTVLPPGTGKKGMVLAGSGGSFECYQDTTSGAAYAAGTQFLAMIMARAASTVTGTIKVCARQAGVTSSTLCATVMKDGVFRPAKVPFLGNSSSNGIAIVGTTVTGNVYLDHAFVGAVDLKQEGDASRFLGTVYYSSGGTNTSGWRNYTGTGSVTSGSGITFNNTTKEITLEQAGDYQIHGYIAYNASTANIGLATGFTVNGVNEQCATVAFGNGDTGPRPRTVCNLKNLPAGSKLILRQYTGGNVSGDNAAVDIFRFASGSTYSSTNADTDWAACSFSTLAWQGLGTVTSNLRCKRDGSDLIVTGKVTAGTLTASLIQIPLPLWNGSQLSTASNQKVPQISYIGHGLRDNSVAGAAHHYTFLAEPSLPYIFMGYTFDTTSNETNPLTKRAGTALMGNGESFFINNARIPIEGWENSNIIIGQFNGLESCKDSYECTDVFSAKIAGLSAGAVSDENLDFINGNCTVSTGTVTCPLRTGLAGNGSNLTSVMNCTGSVRNPSTTTSRSVQFSTASTASSLVFITTENSTASNLDFNIICQKQGADYIGKTAKAVASDQNVRSIGAVGVDIQSVYFGLGASCTTTCTTSPCAICSQVGSKVTQVTREGAGIYRINGIDGTKYICFGNGDSTSQVQFDRANSTTSYVRMLFRTGSPALADVSSSSVTCIGVP